MISIADCKALASLQVVRNQDGEAVTLSSYQGKSAVVLFFYPKAATPGCTAEANAFKQKYQSFIDQGAVVCFWFNHTVVLRVSCVLCNVTDLHILSRARFKWEPFP